MNNLPSIIKFIRSTFHEPEAFIPLHNLHFIGNEKKKYLPEWFYSNFVSSVGEYYLKIEHLTKYSFRCKRKKVSFTNENHLYMLSKLTIKQVINSQKERLDSMDSGLTRHITNFAKPNRMH